MHDFRRRRYLLVLLLGFSLIVILMLAGSLPNLRFRPGKSLNLIDWFFAKLALDNPSDLPEFTGIYTRTNFLPEIGEVLLKSLIAAFWLMVIFSVLILIVSPKFRRELMRMIAMVIPLVILLPQIAKTMAQQSEMAEEQQAGGHLLGEATYPQPPDFIQNPPEWLFLVINTLLLLIILGGIFYLWRRFRPKSDAHAVVVKEVRRALSNLDSGLELKDVVIACYAQMCRGLQESQQITRHQAMTPREFELHLSSAGIASIHIKQLTRLFEGVRYGQESTDADTENDARRCLQSILEVYVG